MLVCALRLSSRLLLAMTVGIALEAGVSAQTIGGKLSGTVTDSNGAVVANARVVAKNVAANVERETTTDLNGQYFLSELRPGKYVVRISAEGFRTFQAESVDVQVATQTSLDATLQTGPVTEVINVVGGTTQIETHTSDLGGVVTGQTTRDLPLNGRDFAQLTRLVAGASVDSEGGAGAFVVNGQRASSNNFLVDGVDANNPFLQINASGPSGTSAAIASVDAIQEFKVQTDLYSAEFGRFSGAVVNLITRSGNNDYHGSTYEFFRNNVLDSNNLFLKAAGFDRPPLHNNQYGGVFGGPLMKDRSFFFISYEGIQQSFASIANGTVPSLLARSIADPRIRPVVDQIVLPNGPSVAGNPLLAQFTGSTASSIDENNFSVRVDHQITSRDLFFARYSFGDGTQEFPSSAVGVPPNVVERTPSRVQNLAVNWTHPFTSRLVNEARFGFNRQSSSSNNMALSLFGAIPAPVIGQTPVFPTVIVADETLNNNIVGGATGPDRNAFNTFQAIDNLTWARDNHTVKFGFDFRRVQINRINESDNGGTAGIIIFPSTQALIGDVPQAFINQTGNRYRAFRFSNFDFYGQDDYRLLSNFTLNLGLRYELNTVLSENHGLLTNVVADSSGRLVLTSPGGDPYRGDHNNWAPRVGFAYSPFQSARLALRGGFGVYYDLNTLIATNLASNPPVTKINTVFQSPTPPFLQWPDFLPLLPFITAPFGAAAQVPLNLRSPYSYHYNLSIQYQLPADTLVQVAWVGSRGVKLLRERISNFLLPFGLVPGPVTCCTDRRFGLIEVNEDSAQSHYESMQVTLNHKFNRAFMVLANYTWSHSIDDASTLGLFGTSIFGARSASPFPSDPNNARLERGHSNFDVRHVLSISYIVYLPIKQLLLKNAPSGLADGWTIQGVTSIRTGQPYTVALGFDNAGVGDVTPFFSQRPNYVAGQPLTLGDRRGPDLRLNPAAFAVPAPGTFGNLGRNTLRGPGFSQFDFSIFKITKLTERLSMQFRAEFFNIFNHPNFALPTESANLLVPPNQLGVSTSTVNTQNQTVGSVFAQGGPRNIQFAIRFNF